MILPWFTIFSPCTDMSKSPRDTKTNNFNSIRNTWYKSSCWNFLWTYLIYFSPFIFWPKDNLSATFLKKGLPNLNSNKISLTMFFYSLPLNKSTLISKVTTIPMLISNNPIAIWGEGKTIFNLFPLTLSNPLKYRWKIE